MTHDNTDDVRKQYAVTVPKRWYFQRGWSSPGQPWFRIYRWSPTHMPYWGYWGLVLGKREYRLWWEGEGPGDVSEEACCRIINLAELMTRQDIRNMAQYLYQLAEVEDKRASEKRGRFSDFLPIKEDCR